MKIILSSRKHHYLAVVSIFLIIVAFIAGTVSCSCGGGGDGDVMEIKTWYELDVVRKDLEGNYVLMEDLDDTMEGYAQLVGETKDGKGWKPIGTDGNAFKGTFDGNSKTISDLFINRPDEEDVGLFGRIQDGVIKNVGLESVNVTGKKSVGALVGYSWKGLIESDTQPQPSGSKTYSHGIVTGEEDVGGLVGNNYGGTVNQCESSARVFHVSNASNGDRWRAGGLVGLNSGPVLHCDYNGEVNGDRQVGGLVGHNAILTGRVELCGGKYSVNGNLEVGGVAGRNMGDIRWSSFTGEVNGILISDGLVALNEGATGNAYSSDTALQGLYVGGVVGVNNGTVEECTSLGSVYGEDYVGGVAGANNGNVDDCGSDSEVTGTDHVGGLVGANGGSYVSRCSFSGDVTGDSNVGGLVGHNKGTVTNSHYNYDEVLINEQHMITLGALSADDFEDWMDGDKSLDVTKKLTQQDGYYVINDVDDFKKLLAFGQDSSLKFRLTNDLDLGSDRNFYIPYLAGEFDGHGNKISNLNLDFDSVSNVGLFGYLAGGMVNELGVENVDITGFEAVGGLVGWNEEGTVSDSYSTGSVTGETQVGGLVGGNNGTVTNSYATGIVAGSMGVGGLSAWGGYGHPPSIPGGQYIGGLVGANFGLVSNSHSESYVIGNEYVGGLVGVNYYGSVTDSYSVASVTGMNIVGGLVGLNEGGTVINSHSSASLIGDFNVGCLVGYNTGTLINCDCVQTPIP